MIQPSVKYHSLLPALLTVTALTTGLWSSCTRAGQAQSLPVSGVPGLTVVGTGTVAVPADNALVVLSYYFIPNDSNMLATMSLSPQIRPADYQPILAALAEAGVTNVKTVTDVSSPFVRMQFSLTQPTLERLIPIITAANAAATKDNRFAIGSVNVGLTVNDCTAVETTARQLALADLQQRTQAFATAAGVQLGDRVAIADSTDWSSLLTGACPATANIDSAYADFPVVDLRLGTTVRVFYQVTATYEVKRR